VPDRRACRREYSTARHGCMGAAAHSAQGTDLRKKARPMRDRAMGTANLKMLIGGEWREGAETYDVRDPYRGEVVTKAPKSTRKDHDDALAAATAAKAAAAAMPAYERAAILRKVAQLLVARADEIAEVMTRETGKAIADARAEVTRSQDTVQLSAEEAIRIQGEQVPLDGSAMGAGKLALLL